MQSDSEEVVQEHSVASKQAEVYEPCPQVEREHFVVFWQAELLGVELQIG